MNQRKTNEKHFSLEIHLKNIREQLRGHWIIIIHQPWTSSIDCFFWNWNNLQRWGNQNDAFLAFSQNVPFYGLKKKNVEVKLKLINFSTSIVQVYFIIQNVFSAQFADTHKKHVPNIRRLRRCCFKWPTHTEKRSNSETC